MRALNTKKYKNTENYYQSQIRTSDITEQVFVDLEAAYDVYSGQPPCSFSCVPLCEPCNKAIEQGNIIIITDEQWQSLEQYLTAPLTHKKCDKVFDFLESVLINDWFESIQPTPTPAQIKKHLINLKKTYYNLVQTHQNKQSHHIEPMPNEVEDLIKKAFILMGLEKDLPRCASQYYCAATIALDLLPKTPTKGNITKNELGLYRNLLLLWKYDLEETNLSNFHYENHTPPSISNLLGFTYTLFNIIGDLTQTKPKSIHSIRKNLSKYIKQIESLKSN